MLIGWWSNENSETEVVQKLQFFFIGLVLKVEISFLLSMKLTFNAKNYKIKK